MASVNMTIKLVVDNGTKKVLYAEATKEFVDFLLYFFTLPLCTVNQILGPKGMAGGFGKLKESVESFNQIYFQPGINKENIFISKTACSGNKFMLFNDVSASDKPDTSTKVYSCNSFHHYSSVNRYCRSVTENPATSCPTCKRLMNVPLNLIGLPGVKEAEGKLRESFVKEAVTYMVMDDLVVKPMSTILSINLIKSFALKDLSQLEEKTLELGKDETLTLLRASLSTNEVLTTLFRQTIGVKKEVDTEREWTSPQVTKKRKEGWNVGG